jgi:hypothetical protein
MLNRELQHTKVDISLLMLERMRMIDIGHSWATGTLAKYGGSLLRLQRFTAWSGVPTLVPTVLERPPVSPSISIQWAQLQHSLQPTSDGGSVTYNSVSVGEYDGPANKAPDMMGFPGTCCLMRFMMVTTDGEIVILCGNDRRRCKKKGHAEAARAEEGKRGA